MKDVVQLRLLNSTFGRPIINPIEFVVKNTQKIFRVINKL